MNTDYEIEDFIDEACDAMDVIVSRCDKVSACKLNLDVRCGTAYIDSNQSVIVVKKSSLKSFLYYGGFEYIDEEFVVVIGDYTVFKRDDDRVDAALDYYANNVKNG